MTDQLRSGLECRNFCVLQTVEEDKVKRREVERIKAQKEAMKDGDGKGRKRMKMDSFKGDTDPTPGAERVEPNIEALRAQNKGKRAKVSAEVFTN